MKKILLFSIALFAVLFLYAQNNGTSTTAGNVALQGGVGLGSVIAVVASWSRNESILWAILHALFGWLYVIHFAITRESER